MSDDQDRPKWERWTRRFVVKGHFRRVRRRWIDEYGVEQEKVDVVWVPPHVSRPPRPPHPG